MNEPKVLSWIKAKRLDALVVPGTFRFELLRKQEANLFKKLKVVTLYGFPGPGVAGVDFHMDRLERQGLILLGDLLKRSSPENEAQIIFLPPRWIAPEARIRDRG